MARKHDTAKAVRERKWYGMKTVKKGQKVCWIAKEDKNGWAIGLAFNDRTLWLRNFRVPTQNEAQRICQKSSIVFFHLKASKEDAQYSKNLVKHYSKTK